LGIPESVQKVVVEGDAPTVIENDRAVLPGDRLPPPLVVDTPSLTNRLHATGWLSGKADELGVAELVCTHVYDAWQAQRT
jgi:hypothetical protein